MRRELLERVRQLLEEDEPFVRATVVRRRPPTSSRLGDAAVITRHGELHGWIGGSCTTPEVIRQALLAIEEGRPRRVAFGFDDGEACDDGTGDGNAGDRDTRGGEARDDDARGDDAVVVPMTCRSGGSVEVYIEPVVPAPRLLVVGTSPICRALARLGDAVGWSVSLIDPTRDPAARGDEGPSVAGPEQESGGFAGDVLASVGELPASLADRPSSGKLFCLVATMGQADERTVVELLELRPDYLGVITSPGRMDEIRERLVRQGVGSGTLEALRGPAGLDLGGTTPEEIAVSVVAEIVQLHRGGISLRDLEGASSASAAGSKHGDPAVRSKDGDPATTRDVGDWATDPVCGMSVETDGSRPTAEHAGVTFHFCCEGCRDRFVDDPEPYLTREQLEEA